MVMSAWLGGWWLDICMVSTASGYSGTSECRSGGGAGTLEMGRGLQGRMVEGVFRVQPLAVTIVGVDMAERPGNFSVDIDLPDSYACILNALILRLRALLPTSQCRRWLEALHGTP